jgi:hypothetical protein
LLQQQAQQQAQQLCMSDGSGMSTVYSGGFVTATGWPFIMAGGRCCSPRRKVLTAG